MKEKDITGMRFGRLVAVRPLGKYRNFQLYWECRCDCGKVVAVNKKNLVHGHTRSCGCLRRDLMKDLRHGTATVGPSRKNGED